MTCKFVLASVAALGLAVAMTGAASAACVMKAGQGTNTTKDGAVFQAYEAVLQATSWVTWSAWMAAGGKVGTAPGYKVSGLKQRCKKGGLGYSCRVQAKLCN